MSGENEATPERPVSGAERYEMERRGGTDGLFRSRRARRRPDDDCAYPSPRKAGELDPEWVMCGVDVPAGKRLYASKDLKGSAFQLAIDQHGNGDGWHLTTTMCHMLVITKPTYAECLAELMRIWQNWENEGRELPAGPAGGRALWAPRSSPRCGNAPTLCNGTQRPSWARGAGPSPTR